MIMLSHRIYLFLTIAENVSIDGKRRDKKYSLVEEKIKYVLSHEYNVVQGKFHR